MASSSPPPPSSSPEIVLVPLPHPGHMFPCIELANRLAAYNSPIAIFLPESFIPAAGGLHPLVEAIGLPIPDPARIKPHVLEEMLRPAVTARLAGAGDRLPQFAIVDVMASGIVGAFTSRRIPTALLFTSSACSIVFSSAAAASWKEGYISIPGATDRAPVSLADLDHSPEEGGGRPGPPPAALLVNTCDELEGALVSHVAAARGAAGRPVWGVGPLLPARFWAGAGDDAEVRSSGQPSSAEVGEVERWLDGHAPGSVVYVSFGTLDPPCDGELAELGAALRESGRPFLWVARGRGAGLTRAEMEAAAGGRGMVVEGWAPQLGILRHPATGGYVCHCGWNSTLEAVASGTPVAAWPMCGDQFDNAWLLTDRLRVGVRVKRGAAEPVTRGDVLRGIERIMSGDGNNEFRRRAAEVREIFAGGFPRSSADAMDAFLRYVKVGAHHH